MLLFGTQAINEAGHLEIGGCDTVKLVEDFGSPLYVLDEEHMRERCQAYRKAFESRLERVEIAFAGKALLCTAICRIVEQEGMALDVCSAGELYTAQKASFPLDHCKFHGNFKSDLEIEMALKAPVGRIVADSFSELERLSAAAGRLGTTAEILIRIGPGIKTQTHAFVQTGQQDSKFGIGIAGGCALEAVKTALRLPNIRVAGVHCHIGSQLFGLESFEKATDIMIEFLSDVRRECGVTLGELDMGGGLGISYTAEDAPPTVDHLADVICGALRGSCERLDFPLPKLILEPGRSIVGTAGTTLYTVGPVKEIPGLRTYAAVDGGLSDNPRPAMYDSEYMCAVASDMTAPATRIYRIAGKHCETDTLLPETPLAEVNEGDILAVMCTGAYNYAMASNYNRFPKPAVVAVAGGQADLIVRRQSLDDVTAQDVIPERLAG
jgi:diaminopimelate decarboxylase